MKLMNVLDIGVQVELFPDDCLVIADALARYGDGPGNRSLLAALQTAFRACAILGASDTNMDDNTPAREWFAKTRRVWAVVDTSTPGCSKVSEEPE